MDTNSNLKSDPPFEGGLVLISGGCFVSHILLGEEYRNSIAPHSDKAIYQK